MNSEKNAFTRSNILQFNFRKEIRSNFELVIHTYPNICDEKKKKIKMKTIIINNLKATSMKL